MGVDVRGKRLMKGMESDLRLLLGLVVLYWQLENWSELSFWMIEMLWGD